MRLGVRPGKLGIKLGGWPYGRPPFDMPFELNKSSKQARELLAWWPGSGQHRANVLRDYTGNGHDADRSTNSSWGVDEKMGNGYGGAGGSASQWTLREDLEFASGVPFSIACWCKATAWDGGAYGPLMGNLYTTNNKTRIYYDDSLHEIVLEDEVSANPTDAVSWTMSLNTPYHICWTYDGTYKRFYANGGYVGTSTETGAKEHNWHALAGIGDGTWQWIGHMYDTRFYGRVLSAAEALDQYRDPWELCRFRAPFTVARVTGTGAQTLGPSAIASLEAFGTQQLNFALALSAIESLEAFGTQQLNLPIALAGIETLEAFGTQQLNLALALSAIESLEAFGTQQLNFALALTGISSLEVFGDPTVQADQIIVLSAIDSGETFGVVLIPSGMGRTYWDMILLFPRRGAVQ
jgi:hypothetical protein